MPQAYIIIPPQGSDQADEWMRLGVEAQVSGQLGVAQQRYQQALRLDPRHALATQNLAIVFAQSNFLNEALLTIERAAMMDGVHGVIKMNWALMALESERIDEALQRADEALAIAPDDPACLFAAANIYGVAGMPDKSISMHEKVLAKDPKHAAAGPNACFATSLLAVGPEEVLRYRKRWWEANHFTGKIQPHQNDRTENRTLRVGYVGGDFKGHSAAYIFGNVLFNHSSAVEMYLYSSLPVDPATDPNTKKFQDACCNHVRDDGEFPLVPRSGSGGWSSNRWRDISAMSDEDADKLIRKDRIDVLVDLAGHTCGGRLALFTRRPAPVQVTAWGFAHGTGCPEVNYFFADPVTIPEAERVHYAEKIVDLPCTVTYSPPEHYHLKGTSNPPFKKNGYVTFGAYARYEKMSDACLKTYAEILRRVPDSRLEFKDNAYRRPYSIRRIIGLMPDIAQHRPLFSIATSHPDHLLAYQQADIVLDPFPHTGGVVGLEQLYMGVPIVTLYGTQAAGRTTSSVLTCLNRKDWIAKTPDEFVEIAVRLANDLPGIAAARKTLRQELLDSPVVKGYVGKVEEAYRAMWKEYICS